MSDTSLVTMVAGLKQAKLKDILRRVIANPGNLDEVVTQICLDWNPPYKVSSDGHIEVVVGDGSKR